MFMGNPFERRIGIYYKDADWRDYIYKTIMEECKEAICQDRGACVLSKNEARIYFLDGSTIRFVPIVDSCRGQRFTDIYLQYNENEILIPKEFYYCNILPVLRSNRPPIMIKEWEDFFNPSALKAQNYYWGFEKLD